RGWTGPMNVLPPPCSILCHLWLQIQLLHVVFNTFKPCLSWSSFATFSFHLNISAGTYPLPSLPYAPRAQTNAIYLSSPPQPPTQYPNASATTHSSSYQTTSPHTFFLPSTSHCALVS